MDFGFEQLALALEVVGLAVVDHPDRAVAVAHRLVAAHARVDDGEAGHADGGARVRDRLTPKELKIVALIVQGYKNKEIANQLGTTEQVIKNYLRNVYDKIGGSDRLELALFTIHHRVLAQAAAEMGSRLDAEEQQAAAPTAVA